MTKKVKKLQKHTFHQNNVNFVRAKNFTQPMQFSNGCTFLMSDWKFREEKIINSCKTRETQWKFRRNTGEIIGEKGEKNQ